MNCPTCGNKNREGANFCRMCGADLSEMPATGGAAVIQAEAESREEPQTEELADQPASSATEPTEELPEIPTLPSLSETEEVGEAPDQPVPVVGLIETKPVDLTSFEEAGLQGQDPLPRPEPAATAQAGKPRVPPEPEMVAEEPEAERDEVTLTALVTDAGEDSDLAEEPAFEDDVAASAAGLPAEAQAPEVQEEPEHESVPDSDSVTVQAEAEDTALIPPLTAGTEVAGRYVIVEALDVQESKTLYHAHDMQGCWQCGFEENTADDAFCAQCGAQMDHRPQVLLLEVHGGQAEPSEGQAVAAELDYEGRRILLLAEAEPEAGLQAAHQNLRLVVGQRSDPGQVRALDEDSLLVLTVAPTYESISGPVLGLFAVADGMGGHEGGEIASKIALQVLAENALQAIILPELSGQSAVEETVLNRLKEATVAANDAVYLARQKRQNDMGTTLTTILVRDDRLFFTHVGDCRFYRWDARGLEQLTTDHSLVASMIASGQAEPEEIYTHPHRSVVYRCIGDKPVVEVDTGMLTTSAGDRIILCCDGLWEMIRDEGIEDVMMQEADPQAACDLMVNHANLAGGEDNISVIVIQIEEF